MTNHGVQQAIRLGRFLTNSGVFFTHIFSSHLRRAVKTAELIREAQPCPVDTGSGNERPAIMSLSILREKDFGSYEGRPYHTMPRASKRSGRMNRSGPVDVESKESLARRMDLYLEEHLLPIMRSSGSENKHVVAVVAHGVVLSTLWRRLLVRLPPTSVRCHPELLAVRKTINLEHLGGYSNTGYLELDLQSHDHETLPRLRGGTVEMSVDDSLALQHRVEEQPLNAVNVRHMVGLETMPDVCGDKATDNTDTVVSVVLNAVVSGWSATIMVINGQRHLKDLKRARGGLGSARHDEEQTKIDAFFKRRRVG